MKSHRETKASIKHFLGTKREIKAVLSLNNKSVFYNQICPRTIRSFLLVSGIFQPPPNRHMSFSNMGICMCSSTRQITAPELVPSPAVPRSPKRLDPAIKRMLIDLKKVRTVPVLCIEKNSLCKRRSEQHSEDVSRDTMHSPISLETQEQTLHVPFLHTFVESYS